MSTNKRENIVLLLHLSTSLSAGRLTAWHAAEGMQGVHSIMYWTCTAQPSHARSLCNCCIKVVLSLNQVKTNKKPVGLDQAGRPGLFPSVPLHGENSQPPLKVARAMQAAETWGFTARSLRSLGMPGRLQTYMWMWKHAICASERPVCQECPI